jgi:hypothetical protein
MLIELKILSAKAIFSITLRLLNLLKLFSCSGEIFILSKKFWLSHISQLSAEETFLKVHSAHVFSLLALILLSLPLAELSSEYLLLFTNLLVAANSFCSCSKFLFLFILHMSHLSALQKFSNEQNKQFQP